MFEVGSWKWKMTTFFFVDAWINDSSFSVSLIEFDVCVDLSLFLSFFLSLCCPFISVAIVFLNELKWKGCVIRQPTFDELRVYERERRLEREREREGKYGFRITC